jgi:hypothetical protein
MNTMLSVLAAKKQDIHISAHHSTIRKIPKNASRQTCDKDIKGQCA